MDLAVQISDRSPRGIASTIAQLVGSGMLAPGDRLPTVRALGVALGVSPATVGVAYRTLTAVGVVASRGRDGTRVLARPPQRLPLSFRDLRRGDEATWLDLSRGTPDPDLLPPLADALAAVAAMHVSGATWTYADPPVVPELEHLLRTSWPWQAETFTVVDGALDGVVRLLALAVRFGDAVAVEAPGFPPIFDMIDRLGAVGVPLHLDAHGVTPESLEAALAGGATVVVLQPRAHNPTGVSLTATRARDLAAVVRHFSGSDDPDGGSAPVRRSHRVLVIEDDHSGLIASARDISLGTWLPDQVVRIRSYSKSHGPDLRIAAVGGPAHEVEALTSARMIGPGWTSRMLQDTLVRLLRDDSATARVDLARRTYRARQERLAELLRAQGVDVAPGDGINLWLPVADEQAALDRLAAMGVRAVAGQAFHRGTLADQGHLRLTVSTIGDDVEQLARVLAAAAAP